MEQAYHSKEAWCSQEEIAEKIVFHAALLARISPTYEEDNHDR
jgi:hypothetical protein